MHCTINNSTADMENVSTARLLAPYLVLSTASAKTQAWQEVRRARRARMHACTLLAHIHDM